MGVLPTVRINTQRKHNERQFVKKVITYGTFDLLHHGHISLLKRARDMGDHLTVALSTDNFNACKGKKCFQSYADRAALLNAIRYVDKLIPETSWEQKIDDVKQLGIDIFVIGDDWEGKFDFLKNYCEVIYLPRTPGISTTQIKSQLKDLARG
jgi:glycerol-3-phosphate cytidylyltransferase